MSHVSTLRAPRQSPGTQSSESPALSELFTVRGPHEESAKFAALERDLTRLLDPSRVLIEKRELDALKLDVDAARRDQENLRTLVSVVREIKQRSEQADALAYQTFVALVTVCAELGLTVGIDDNARVQVTGAADDSADRLALHQEVRRMR